MKICDTCRRKLTKQLKDSSEANIEGVSHDNPIAGTSNDDCTFIDADTSLEYLNKSLELVGESPIKKKPSEWMLRQKEIWKSKNKSRKTFN